MDLLISGAYAIVSSPVSIMVFMSALMGGLIFGSIPGVNILTLAAVILPFTIYLPASDAIMFFGVLYVSGVYGGAITAILFNIPGSPENAPTALDGYPMTQQGQASRAIGAAVTASAIGGTLSCILVIATIRPVSNWAITSFGPVEIFALVIFGLCACAGIGSDNYWKGWISILFGMLLATVGTEPSSGLPRFTFGSSYFMAGINFVALVIGLFAVSEVFMQAIQRREKQKNTNKNGINFPSVKELISLRGVGLRSTGIGFFCGLLPGIGATLAAFLSYSLASKTRKTEPEFGKGNIEGVVSSETANNAATSSALIPLLALGLPGGALTAIMLGAFQMHNIQPGPLVFITSESLVWMLFAAMLIASVCILFLGYVETRVIVYLLRIPMALLGPCIITLAIVGAFALRNLVLDVWVALAAGLFGLLLRFSGYSTAGLVLGLILGAIAEDQTIRVVQILDRLPLHIASRPIALLLLCIAASLFIYSLWKEFLKIRCKLTGVVNGGVK